MALTAVRGEKTLAELAQQHDWHPNRIFDWKSHLATRALGDTQANEPPVDPRFLHAMIGQWALGRCRSDPGISPRSHDRIKEIPSQSKLYYAQGELRGGAFPGEQTMGMHLAALRVRVVKMFMVASMMIAGLGSAQASELWTWTFSGTGNTGSGALTTNDLTSGSYLITAVTGIWDGSPIIGVAPPGSCCVAAPYNDNLLFPGSPQLDVAGFAFNTSATTLNIFDYSTFGYVVNDQFGTLSQNAIFSAQATSVPEPSSIALLGTAFVGFAGVRRSRRRMSGTPTSI